MSTNVNSPTTVRATEAVLGGEMKELSVKSPETNIVYHENKLKTHNGTGIFLQFFDNIGGSSTFTYLIGDTETKECILIDPVLECMDRDLQKIQELGLTLVYGINTHCHADHITSTGKMKTKTTTMKSVISETSGAVADLKINDGDDIKWANGKRTLKCISTPGHTNGCMSYFDADIGSVFTGDTLLIDGCGRTDFQEGSSENLYNSVHNKLFTLPSSTIVYPGHDYKGRVRSTIGHEKKYNSRLTLPLNEYVELMKNLGLSYPKKIDVAVPANMICGV
jgi:sulfur dioxygenase